MKILLMVMLAMFSFNANAFRVETVSLKNLGSFSEIRCGQNVDCEQRDGNTVEIYVTSLEQVTKVSITGSLAGDGGAGDVFYGFRANTISVSADKTLDTSECGSTLIGLADVSITLPDAGAAFGCEYTFINGNDVSSLYVNPEATDNIEFLTNAVGDGVLSNTLGDTLTLIAISVDQWAVLATSSLTEWVDADEN